MQSWFHLSSKKLRVTAFLWAILYGLIPSSKSFAQTILCLGDSLTEGYGLKREEAWPILLEKELRAKHPKIKVINAGISGATSASGPSRMKWHLKMLAKEPIDIAIIALGANDALRGLDLVSAQKNLATTIELAQTAKLKIVLAGMKAPPSIGADYAKKFETLYRTLAQEMKVPLIPFLLDGVAADPKLNLPDGIHPNALGHRIVAKTVQKTVEPLL